MTIRPKTTTTMSLGDALRTAIAAEEAADIAYYGGGDVDAEGPERAAWLAACSATAAVRAALAASDEPREYVVRWCDGSGVVEDIVSTPSAIRSDIESRARSCDYGDDDSTTYVDVRWSCIDGTDEMMTIVIEDPEPDCAHIDGHDWQAPYAVLGGCRANPGVRAHGGGVVRRDVCAHCGMYRVTDTWAQRPNTGKQGLTETTYEDTDNDSLTWVGARHHPKKSHK